MDDPLQRLEAVKSTTISNQLLLRFGMIEPRDLAIITARLLPKPNKRPGNHGGSAPFPRTNRRTIRKGVERDEWASYYLRLCVVQRGDFSAHTVNARRSLDKELF